MTPAVWVSCFAVLPTSSFHNLTASTLQKKSIRPKYCKCYVLLAQMLKLLEHLTKGQIDLWGALI